MRRLSRGSVGLTFSACIGLGVLACGGGGGSNNKDAAGGKGGSQDGGGGTGGSIDGSGGTGGKIDSGGDRGAPEAEVRPPPPINPDAKRLTDVRATLVGTGDSSCTNGRESGDVWCAFVK